MHLSQRIQAIEPSPTVSLDARAKELARQGVDIINLAAGEPDFDTPAHVKAAAWAALEAGFTKYTAVPGIPELREAIAARVQRDLGERCRPDEVVVTNGAKQALYQAFQATCDPGDEVIVVGPYWVSYTEQARLAGAVPVVAPARDDDGFSLDPDAIRARITPRTRVINLNSPNNPTGAVYDRAALEAVARLAVEHDLVLFSDEIYDKLVYDGARHVSPIAFGPEVRQRTVLFNGLSKAYAMTGWRVGYACAPAPVARAMVALQGHLTSNIASFVQRAAAAALEGSDDAVFSMVEAFDERRRFVVERLKRMPGVYLTPPRGAFYAFFDVSELFGHEFRGQAVRASSDLAQLCLEVARVAVVPGVAFGDDRYLRLSYAAGLDDLGRAMDRLEALFGELAGAPAGTRAAGAARGGGGPAPGPALAGTPPGG